MAPRTGCSICGAQGTVNMCGPCFQTRAQLGTMRVVVLVSVARGQWVQVP